MADKDYNFTVLAQDLAPYTAAKENADILRLVYDFSCYLDAGETISQIARATIDVIPPGTTPVQWRQDYPVENLDITQPVYDNYRLGIISQNIAGSGNVVEIMVDAGTPDFTYVMSFVIIGAVSQRHKEVDTLITIEQPVNPLMVGPGGVISDTGQVITIGGTTNLPLGFDGLVILNNSGNVSNIIITMPQVPTMGQSIEFIDALGKDGAYPVTFQGANNAAIDGDGSLTFVSFINYDCLRWKWTGSNWHLMATRFNFLA